MNGEKGWFVTPVRDGDRTLAQQMTGLTPLLSMVEGKTVLDVGCAEGLIALEVAQAGAALVDGIEIVHSHVGHARQFATQRGLENVRFHGADANEWNPSRRYDVVLLLAVLHKLRNPSERAGVFADWANEWVVIRLPPSGAVIVDERSKNEPHDIARVMKRAGFYMAIETVGPFDEWLAYYRRG